MDELEELVIEDPDDPDDEDNSKKKKKKKHLETLSSTQNFIPVRDVQRGIIITTDGRFVKLMEFSPINFELRSNDEQTAIISQFAAVLRSMPITVQFKVISNRADLTNFTRRIQEDMKTEPNQKCVQLQRQQIELIQRVGASSGITRHFYVAFEYSEIKRFGKSAKFPEIAAELDRQGRVLKTELRKCGNEQVSIDGDDEWTLSALFSITCRAESMHSSYSERMISVIAKYAAVQEIDFSKSPLILPVNDFIAPRRIDRGSGTKYIVIDGLYYTIAFITASSYPVRAVAGWPQILINMGEGIDIDFWIHKEEVTAIRRKLQYKLRFNKIKIRDTEDTSQDYDDIEAALQSGYYLKSGLASGDEFTYFGGMITVSASSYEELMYKYTEVKNYCIRQDLTLKQCNFRQMTAFNMTLPLCTLEPGLWDKMKRNALLSQAASMYPFTSFEMSDEDGILLGKSAQNGSLVFVDAFDTKKYSNANFAILGTSGSGKSYTMQCMALRMRERKIQIFIIAPLKGFEFERACRAIGGQFIKISPGSGQNINIMEIRKMNDVFNRVVDGNSAANESILAKKIQQLHTFFALLAPDISYEEKQVLDEALIATYKKFGITDKNRSLDDPNNPGHYKKMPILGDLHTTLGEMGEPASRLHSILTRFVSGSAASFNSQTNVNLDNQYIVLDVSSLTKEMLPVGMFIALDYVWDKAREDRTARKAIFVDETWRLIGPDSSVLAAEFVLEIFKVIRGYGGAAIAATQDMNDFFALDNGRFGTGIINNSRIKLLLKPEPKEAETLAGVFELTSAEVESLKMVDRGTCLLVANSNHIFINVEASPAEHDLITTDRKDLIRIAQEANNE